MVNRFLRRKTKNFAPSLEGYQSSSFGTRRQERLPSVSCVLGLGSSTFRCSGRCWSSTSAYSLGSQVRLILALLSSRTTCFELTRPTSSAETNTAYDQVPLCSVLFRQGKIQFAQRALSITYRLQRHSASSLMVWTRVSNYRLLVASEGRRIQGNSRLFEIMRVHAQIYVMHNTGKTVGI